MLNLFGMKRSMILVLSVFLLSCEKNHDGFLTKTDFKHYIEKFNEQDQQELQEDIIPNITMIRNSETWQFIEENIPFFECPDKEIEEVYYYRWWTYRKHIRGTPDGYVITEFFPKVAWAKKHNTINCPVGHHLYEGRWLHDQKYLDDYILFYFRKGGDPGGSAKVYSNWITDGIYARFLVNPDREFVIGLLDELIANYEAWSRDGAPGDPWQESRRLKGGLYWQIDSWEGQEFSIGGTGIRVPINSYMFGDAVALSRICELAGKSDLAAKYREQAEQLRTLVQEQLWDANDRFFKTRRLKQKPFQQYDNFAAEYCKPGALVSVREIFGYVPWLFNLPEDGKGYEEAWLQLTDPQGFLGTYGPTVAERRHPNFRINESGCMWCGASWPFSTSQTLTALANLLNNYKQDVMGQKEYFDTFRAYSRSHQWKKDDGTVVTWVDESLNPDTGGWIVNWQGKDDK